MTKAQPTEATQPQVQRDDTVRCKACEGAVTRERHSLQREHTFRNPAGYSFHVLCYAEADGSRAEGHPTSAATWFPGFAWSFALCVGCGEHLGWWYSSPTESFAGLIATRLLRPRL